MWLLFCLWAALLFGGFLFGTEQPDEQRRMPRWTRLASSLTLVVAAWFWVSATESAAFDSLAIWIAIGMSLGFLGDIFMAQKSASGVHIIRGMLSFGLGHIAYIVGLFTVTTVPINILIVSVLIMWFIATILWYFVVMRGNRVTTLHALSLPYAYLLATTTAVAITLVTQVPSLICIPIGAMLFLISDLILAGELFSELRWRYLGDLVWFTYGPGQMLIVFGSFFGLFLT